MTDEITSDVLATRFGMEWQCRFRVGVQYFDIGPRYETRAEAEWMGRQLVIALRTFVKLNTGITLVEQPEMLHCETHTGWAHDCPDCHAMYPTT